MLNTTMILHHNKNDFIIDTIIKFTTSNKMSEEKDIEKFLYKEYFISKYSYFWYSKEGLGMLNKIVSKSNSLLCYDNYKKNLFILLDKTKISNEKEIRKLVKKEIVRISKKKSVIDELETLLLLRITNHNKKVLIKSLKDYSIKTLFYKKLNNICCLHEDDFLYLTRNKTFKDILVKDLKTDTSFILRIIIVLSHRVLFETFKMFRSTSKL